MAQDKAASVLNRFGLGARPGERQRIGEPREWLLAQLDQTDASAAFLSLPSSADYLQRELAYNRERMMRRRAQ